jgi:dimethylhistidine N-methyltransferase
MADILPIPVAAVCADFYAPIEIPKKVLPDPDHWLGYFPGSTLGNMTPDDAVGFLTRSSKTLGPGAQFLLGIDLEKDKAVLEAAYNDAKGVTAAFNMNLLARMKTELGAKLMIDDFEHYAFYNEEIGRIEMHLRAVRPTVIAIDGQKFNFEAGETLHSENSHKFTIKKIEALINQTPWRLENSWTDADGWFAACLLSNR